VDEETAAKAASRLAALRRDEGGQTFWEVQGKTPFHGWGLAGRVEATALAARALAAHSRGAGADASPSEADGALAARALLYLLRSKDEHGVWYSTQTTVNVLDALTAVSTSRAAGARGASEQDAAAQPSPSSSTGATPPTSRCSARAV